MNSLLNMFVLAAALLQGSDALLIATPGRPVAAAAVSSQRSGELQMGLFDGFAKAFANDDTLGEQKNAGPAAGCRSKMTWPNQSYALAKSGPEQQCLVFGDTGFSTPPACAGRHMCCVLSSDAEIP